MADSITLKRTLGPAALIVYGVGDILGAGIYALTGKVAGMAGEQAWVAFAVAMLVAGLTAFSYAEFSARHPHCGGAAYFVSRVSRRPVAPLLIGWLVLCSGVVSMAAGSRAFTGYLRSMFPVLPEAAVIILFFSAAGFIAFWGIRESSITTIVCTVVSLIGLGIVAVTGLAYYVEFGQAAVAAPAETVTPVSWLGIVGGAALAFYAFIGFEDLANISEEVKNPSRNVPLAILVAVAITGGVYILVAWVATAVLPPAALGASEAPLLDVVRTAAPSVPPVLFTIIAIFAVSDTALINCVMGSRLIYGLSREGLLPAQLGAVHPRRQTPHIAVLAVMAGGLVLALTGTVQNLAGTTSTLLLLVFAAVHIGLLLVKRRETGYDGFQVPRLVPAIGVITCLGLAFFAQGASAGVAAVIFLLGAALIAWRKGWAVREPAT